MLDVGGRNLVTESFTGMSPPIMVTAMEWPEGRSQGVAVASAV